MNTKEIDELRSIIRKLYCIHNGDRLIGSMSDLEDWLRYEAQRMMPLVDDTDNYVHEIMEYNAEVTARENQLSLNHELNQLSA